VLENLQKSKSLEALEKKISKPFSLLLENLKDAPKALFVSFLKEKIDKNILIISGGAREDQFFENLSFFNKDIIEFPSWETLPDENIAPSPDIIGKRFSVLDTILKQKEKKVVIAPLQALLQKTVNKDLLENLLYTFEVGQTVSFEEVPKILLNLGYKKSSVVSDKGDFAIRGGIVDLYSPASDTPYRIEFLNNEIESIRTFDSVSQKTVAKIKKAFICPLKELELVKDKSSSYLLDYLGKETIVILDDLVALEDIYITLKKLNVNQSLYFSSFESFLNELKSLDHVFFIKESIEKLFNGQILKDPSLDRYFQKVTFEVFQKNIVSQRWAHPFLEIEDFLSFESFEDQELDIWNQIQHLSKEASLIFLNENQKEEDFVKENLKERNIAFDSFSFKKGYLSSAFIISDIPIAFIPYSEFSHKKRIRRQKWRSSYHTPPAEYHHLSVGDIVVHFHSGIGKYLGIEKQKNHLGKEEEFLIIEYAKNSKLFVPLSQAYLISRYIGAGEEAPDLTVLGGSKWQKTKILAQKQILGYASDLLHLYAERSEECGFIFPEDSEEMKLFEAEFPYIETPDQLEAINAIKKDMTSKKPMERLICGDVGYGKTEVAMRAAFKAVFDGKKQVAVLVPTTVLAMQHYDSFKERMKDFPIVIEFVSRFNTSKQNQEIIQRAGEGKVDILIGTHRILSKDVLFKDLGLIIVDEEQRFGVRAKEHLKNLKKNVASLAMSATPIPRTLYMSLINARDISVISTPPQDRLPIKTIVAQNDDKIIQNAILRELSREGQTFFIHNRVESIYGRAEYIKSLLPQARLQIVHGQMSSDEIDSIFHSFKQGNSDILMTTTIVENGIDIPNANTIIIDRSDSFGLADLYQLRGRVGRWNRTAYAYLLTPVNSTISPIAKMRLSALLETGGYGGGMRIAMRDLEIRGSGDILGVKQSGQIAEIGFHLYCKLLKRALESLKNKKEVIFTETKMDFAFSASIPEYYISETNLRMEIYHRIGDATSFKSIDELQDELLDRFGTLPKELLFLLSLSKIRIFANVNHLILLKFGRLSLLAQKMKKGKVEEKTFLLPPKIQEDPKTLETYVISELKKQFECFSTID